MPELKNKQGSFHLAIAQGRKELLEFWLANNFYQPEDNNFSETALAAEKGQASCLEFLVAHYLPGSFSCLEVLIKYNAPINETAYYLACYPF